MLHARILLAMLVVYLCSMTVYAEPILIGPTWEVSNDSTSSFGRRLDGAGDVNGDGFDDVLVSSGFGDLRGRAYIYFGSANGPSQTEDWSVVGTVGERLGDSVAGIGDVNGDGYDDVIVGGPEFNGAGPLFDEGIARAYYGAPGGPPNSASWTFVGVFPDYWNIGFGVAGAGDVNGDGFDDALVASGSDDKVLAFYGSPTGLGSAPDWVREFEFLFTGGDSIDGAGDVNGDGFDDIVVGDGFSGVFVYLGSNLGLSDLSVLLPRPAQDVAGAGDIDNDGFDDIVVGVTEGAFVYFGSPAGPTRETRLTGGSIGEDFGNGVSGAGDVDADGFADVLVAAQGSVAPGFRGRVYVYRGMTGGIATNPSQVLEALADNQSFGRSIAAAGNLGRAGLDILVGARSVETTRKAYVYAFSGPREPVTPAVTDIKPGSCPNPTNPRSHGVLPVAVLGTLDYDVTMIDLASLFIARADGVGGSIPPNDGPPGPGPAYEDVGTPFDGEFCDCHDLGGDGLLDLSLKFSIWHLVRELELDQLGASAIVELVVGGSLIDGTPFEARDCVVIVPVGSAFLPPDPEQGSDVLTIDAPVIHDDVGGSAVPPGRFRPQSDLLGALGRTRGLRARLDLVRQLSTRVDAELLPLLNRHLSEIRDDARRSGDAAAEREAVRLLRHLARSDE